MKGFIEVTLYSEGTQKLIALHTIGTVAPANLLKDKPGTIITLSFGKSGKDSLTVQGTYATIKELMEKAQFYNDPLATPGPEDFV
jgi:hypothetical protein